MLVEPELTDFLYDLYRFSACQDIGAPLPLKNVSVIQTF